MTSARLAVLSRRRSCIQAQWGPVATLLPVQIVLRFHRLIGFISLLWLRLVKCIGECTDRKPEQIVTIFLLVADLSHSFPLLDQ